jgi:DNA (cytosine-5)-methyltransferase 1
MRVLDLFSGIGGFSLGLERAGMRTVAFCELDPYCRAVLRKHWPDVPIFEDVRTFAGVECDVICGGFPCQDISFAGKGAGIDGERSGLWREYARLIGELRPRYAIVENVSALLVRGLDRVLGDLAALGYDAEWHCIPASYVGAPHRRDRIWILAYPDSDGCDADGYHEEGAEGAACGATVALSERRADSPRAETMADAKCEGLEGWKEAIRQEEEWRSHPRHFWKGIIFFGRDAKWTTEPDVGRVAHGVHSRVDRLRSLGNAVVPQIPEIIGRAIMSYERTKA